MVIPGLNGWSRLTRASRDAILHRVQSGAGAGSADRLSVM